MHRHARSGPVAEMSGVRSSAWQARRRAVKPAEAAKMRHRRPPFWIDLGQRNPPSLSHERDKWNYKKGFQGPPPSPNSIFKGGGDAKKNPQIHVLALFFLGDYVFNSAAHFFVFLAGAAAEDLHLACEQLLKWPQPPMSFLSLHISMWLWVKILYPQ